MIILKTVFKNIKVMKKIEQLQDRKKLDEGRSFGIGFSILNKINKNKYQTYLPFTACRDYLNDFAYVENTGKEIGKIYGYNHKYLGCFLNKKYFYIGVNTLHYNDNNCNWIKFEESSKLLIDNYKVLEKFLNFIEEKTGIKSRTTIELDEDTLIVRAPIYWSKNTALISVYTLFIRCYFNLKEEDLNKEFYEMLNNNPFISEDKYLKTNCITFCKKLDIDKSFFNNINYGVETMEKKNIKNHIHNYGIVGFLNKQYV